MAKGRKTGGRKKGTPNSLNAAAKETVKAFVDAKAPLIGGLWDQVAAVDEAKAIALWGQIAEYVLPKLGRTEVTGKEGGPVVIDFSVDLGASRKCDT